ncbi:unnamed protein product [Amoebophrya sp. A120]|nr:unnamed protein product [Amoebophrya sp. A120]|eukprot:GSA120T00022262001.1
MPPPQPAEKMTTPIAPAVVPVLPAAATNAVGEEPDHKVAQGSNFSNSNLNPTNSTSSVVVTVEGILNDTTTSDFLQPLTTRLNQDEGFTSTTSVTIKNPVTATLFPVATSSTGTTSSASSSSAALLCSEGAQQDVQYEPIVLLTTPEPHPLLLWQELVLNEPVLLDDKDVANKAGTNHTTAMTTRNLMDNLTDATKSCIEGALSLATAADQEVDAPTTSSTSFAASSTIIAGGAGAGAAKNQKRPGYATSSSRTHFSQVRVENVVIQVTDQQRQQVASNNHNNAVKPPAPAAGAAADKDGADDKRSSLAQQLQLQAELEQRQGKLEVKLGFEMSEHALLALSKIETILNSTKSGARAAKRRRKGKGKGMSEGKRRGKASDSNQEGGKNNAKILISEGADAPEAEHLQHQAATTTAGETKIAKLRLKYENFDTQEVLFRDLCQEIYRYVKDPANRTANQDINLLEEEEEEGDAQFESKTKTARPANAKMNASIVLKPKIISVKRSSLFYQGRYNKYSRELSQTPWHLGGGGGASNEEEKDQMKAKYSVEDLIIAPVAERFGIIPGEKGKQAANSQIKFHAAGREDVDVRMLGKNGRPFVLEIFDARKRPMQMLTCLGQPSSTGLVEQDFSVQLPSRTTTHFMVQAVELAKSKKTEKDDYNLYHWHWYANLPATHKTLFHKLKTEEELVKEEQHIAVHDFKPTTKQFVQLLQQNAEKHTKIYGCLVRSSRKLDKNLLEEEFGKKFLQQNHDQNHIEDEDPRNYDSQKTSLFPIALKQQTPFRVVHRRSNIVREKKILNISHVKFVNDTTFWLMVHADAGCYIKELVNGDYGRTSPSLKDLMNQSGLFHAGVVTETGGRDTTKNGGGSQDDEDQQRKNDGSFQARPGHQHQEVESIAGAGPPRSTTIDHLPLDEQEMEVEKLEQELKLRRFLQEVQSGPLELEMLELDVMDVLD